MPYQVLFLTNILIALLNNAYSDLVADADDAFAAYFATKTIGLVRAPDQYVYPAPLNLLELFLIAPFEFVTSKRVYQQINRVVQTVLIALPLLAIALFEWKVGPKSLGALRLEMLEDAGDVAVRRGEEAGGEHVDSRAQAMAAAIEAQSIEDPDEEAGASSGDDNAAALTISRVSFQKLVAAFPTIQGGSEDDADQDPTTGEVIKREDDDGGQAGASETKAQGDDLLLELLKEVRSLRSELEGLKKEQKTEA